ncbi:unnamed protein product [Orchesella dallaii]|uniref:Uncharacterized protein n=1 Tax=Orchesella dallaii TaxID=48710 RepID=A0ABP1RXR9_9HEXA
MPDSKKNKRKASSSPQQTVVDDETKEIIKLVLETVKNTDEKITFIIDEIETLKANYEKLKADVDTLKEAAAIPKQQIDASDPKIEALEKLSNSLKIQLERQHDTVLQVQENLSLNNLIVHGVPDSEEETGSSLKKRVNEMIKNNLQINAECSSVKRIGTSPSSGEKQRPIRIQFNHVSDRHKVHQNRRLAPKGVFFDPDLTPEQRKRRKILSYNAAKTRGEGANVTILWSTYEILIDGIKHHWKDLPPPDEPSQSGVTPHTNKSTT